VVGTHGSAGVYPGRDTHRFLLIADAVISAIVQR
jgi:hypothetical protein